MALTPPWPELPEFFESAKVVIAKLKARAVDRELLQAVSIGLYYAASQVPLKDPGDLVIRTVAIVTAEDPDGLANQLEHVIGDGLSAAHENLATTLPLPWTTIIAILLKILGLLT